MDALAVLGVPVLTEGVRFLCEQAKELLLRRQRTAAEGAVPEAAEPEGERVALPPAFSGSLDTTSYDEQRLIRAADGLLELRSRLENYSAGLVPLDPRSPELLGDIDRLRQLLEAVYGQSITFAGEAGRPASGARLRAVVDVERVVGEATGTEIRRMRGGEVSAEVRAGQVEAGGRVVGARIEDFGE
ncbi:hypothetical protein [Streptomyces albipurpureus]|uniref:Uncharacterized protein n=1 Tax=Streptomyces albipurpureus TaxID=2897419 RepID=A0ABT0UPI6_9ACTN|nr:hypothetical protein [Streptomyces sp. CWNU-1]MCM2390523.1 hypothetical protein [Streptomyces sp. CWNU-1]